MAVRAGAAPNYERATREVGRRDPAFERLIKQFGPYKPWPPFGDAFSTLAIGILYQQLNGRSAGAIRDRFMALFDGELSPASVEAMPIDRLREAGLSGAKAASVKDLAAKVLDGTVPLGDLHRLTDDDIVARLSSVRGIGPWTAQMFLIIELGRLDVWPVQDYGVRKGWARAHGLAELPTPRELTTLGEIFRPYRTVVAWYCWQAAETALPTTG